MKSYQSRALAIGGAIITLGLGAAASAQQPPAPRPEMAGHQRPDPQAMAARRADHLRTVLQLRPEQEPALRTFLDTIRPAPGAREQMRQGRHEMAQMTTPERLDRMQAKMAERQAMFERRAQATKRFYAALSPSQQKAFDAMGPMMGHGRHGGGHGKGGWGEGHREGMHQRG
jgi:protein CpxP